MGSLKTLESDSVKINLNEKLVNYIQLITFLMSLKSVPEIQNPR